MGRPLTIAEVGRLFGLNLPGPRGKAKCPFVKHQRRDRTFRVFNARASGQEIFKCHRAGQQIVMYDGSLRTVESISVGELVMGPDGRPRKVRCVGGGVGEMVEIRPSRTHGSPWYVNKDHILALEGDRLRHRSVRTIVSVREWERWSAAKRGRFYLYRPGSPITFGGSKPRLLVEPYFLGVLLGDGMMCRGRGWSPGIRTGDAEIVDEIHRQANRLGLRVRVEPHPTAPMYYLAGKKAGGAGGSPRNPLSFAIERLGLRDSRSGTKFIPARYKTASVHARLELLAGLIDTDGSRQGGGKQYSIVSKSKVLMEDAAFVARSLGMSARVVSREYSCQTGHAGTYHLLSIKGVRARDIPCRLARKKITELRSLSGKNSMLVGFTVHPASNRERYFGFTLDGDGLYLLDDFTVTHNCWSCDPPTNVGDAIAFYARMANCERKDAWKRLRDEGFDVPGLDKQSNGGAQRGTSREDQDRAAYEKMVREKHMIDVKGVQPAKTLRLDLEQWERWRKCNEGALEKFAEQRGLPVGFLREHGVVELPGGYVGFTYFDASRRPCRVKVRGVHERKYWVEPRPPKDNPDGAVALGPLYLANELERPKGNRYPLIITEGEIDALSLVYMGFRNVVSLPDGSESAKTVDLTPVFRRYTPWMLATDLDKPGELSAQQLLKDRADGETDLFRVRWLRMVEGGELTGYKDANDALRAGFTREEFLLSLEMAVGNCRWGKPAWRLAG